MKDTSVSETKRFIASQDLKIILTVFLTLNRAVPFYLPVCHFFVSNTGKSEAAFLLTTKEHQVWSLCLLVPTGY